MPLITQGKTNWKFLVIVIVLAAVVGGGILGYCYWCLPKQETLLTKFPEIKKSEQIIERVEKRILLTEENIQEMWKKECFEGEPPFPDFCEAFNQDPPTTEVLYSSKGKGISLKIPYNPKWGNERYEILPYYEYEDRLEFGPLSIKVPAGWNRVFTLSFRPPLSTEELIASLIERAVDDPHAFGVRKESIKKDIIGGHTVVRYRMYEEFPEHEPGGSVTVIEVIGKKYNYEFIACSDRWGWGLLWSEEAAGMLFCVDMVEDILKTIQFIE